MVPMAVLCAVGLVVDDRVLLDAPLWYKPFKFTVSFAAYCLTLSWMLSLLPRGRRVAWWAGTVVAVACVIEIVIITGQAARGKRSHFNYETPFDAAMYNVMGGAVIFLWLATFALAVLLLRSRIADRASTWAMRCGIVLALAGTAVGFLMDRPAPGQQSGVSKVVGAHSIGVPDGGPSMALTGWSTAGGDLRIPHFFGMHALQLLPVLVMVLVALAPRFTRLADDRVRLRLVLLASGVYACVFALLFWQALRGQPLVHPDGVTLGLAGLILVAAVLGTYGSLRAPASPPGETAPDAAEAVGAVKELT
ncbi:MULTISPECIES: hypothetical protein [unclassified Streptomyces]|uniref:hypothetical protein n=1 Tax=unclassified Streptomyces TaxID=2593676 RepID=UPI00225BF652|nr:MULTISPECIES: hypothetical protein [unclassified Streptomyces]MCX4526359.1 hypothetical protein [Streptomyces sp. NBC_01551]MCX4543079.1 hypothetical protein [Streptomyces sp. NBC_01565]